MKYTTLWLALISGLGAEARAQGTPAQPAQHGASPTVSPDGRRIAFMSDRASTGDVYVANADGSDVRRITSDGGHHGRAYWSSDGQRLWITSSAHDTARVFSVPVNGGASVPLGTFEARGGARPLADESHFLLGVGGWTDMQLVTMRADGSGRVQLTSDHAAYWCPGVSVRGDLVAATRNDSAGMQIWMVKADGSGGHPVTRFTKAQGGPQCASFSADGRHIAVQAEVAFPQDTTHTVGYIWVIDLATGHTTRLGEHTAPYHDELPSWFPDGKRLAFQSDRTGRWEVWVMSADGTGAHQVTR
jgi:TolB protein